MKILELFAGTRSIGKAFEKKGHEVFSVEWNKNFKNINLYEDVNNITSDRIKKLFGDVDIIWASFDCTTYSIAAISHHRKKTNNTLEPISEYARFCDKTNKHVIQLIKELKPKFFFIENPRGGLRKMDFMKEFKRYTITYCQYELDKPAEQRRMKPTDIFTNHPDPKFKPMCKNGDKCHAAAPRGSATGTQGIKSKVNRSIIPEQLCEHIVNICEKEIME